jgi:tetratricopeptide (TPR) repeat protein
VQPDLADAYLVRTQVYAAQNNVDAAIENLEKYIELSKDTSLYETVAQLNEAKGDIEAAQAAYDKYVEGAGSEVEEAGFQNGLYKMQAGKLEEAIEAFEAYADDETYGAGAAYNIGICKMNLGDYAGAIEAFNTCQAKGGEFEGLYYNRGVCNLMSEQWKAAAADFTKSIESEPYVDDARYNLAICQMQQEDYETAVATFTELIGDGEAEEQTEVEEEQTEVGEEQTEVENESVVNDGAYYYRAVCNAALGKLEEAKADYTVCIDHGYELAQSYYQRAQVYAALGDTEKQNADLQASLSAAE